MYEEIDGIVKLILVVPQILNRIYGAGHPRIGTVLMLFLGYFDNSTAVRCINQNIVLAVNSRKPGNLRRRRCCSWSGFQARRTQTSFR